jgi:hypothetical protein
LALPQTNSTQFLVTFYDSTATGTGKKREMIINTAKMKNPG